MLANANNSIGRLKGKGYRLRKNLQTKKLEIQCMEGDSNMTSATQISVNKILSFLLKLSETELWG